VLDGEKALHAEVEIEVKQLHERRRRKGKALSSGRGSKAVQAFLDDARRSVELERHEHHALRHCAGYLRAQLASMAGSVRSESDIVRLGSVDIHRNQTMKHAIATKARNAGMVLS
jgi:hypothetical protein